MGDNLIHIPEEFLSESISHTDGELWWGGEIPEWSGENTYPFRHFLVRRDTRDDTAQVIEIERGGAQYLLDRFSLESVAGRMGASVEPGYENRARMREEMLTGFAPTTETPE